MENRSPNLIYPAFWALAEHGIDLCRKKELNIHLFEGYRFPARQRELYRQGRDLPGKIVTNSEPMKSLHQYGLAVDLVFKDMNGQWTWTGAFAAVAEVIEPLHSCIKWGGHFRTPDSPHFQFTPPFTLADMLKYYAEDGGIMNVWEKLDRALKFY